MIHQCHVEMAGEAYVGVLVGNHLKPLHLSQNFVSNAQVVVALLLLSISCSKCINSSIIRYKDED